MTARPISEAAVLDAEAGGVRARMSCNAPSPSAVLAEIAAPSPAYGHGTVVATQKSPKSQSEAEIGFVPRIATT